MNQPGLSNAQSSYIITQEKAEQSFKWFIKAARIKSHRALLSATETKIVFSFETYLRKSDAYNDDQIEKLCRLIRDSDYVKRVDGDMEQERKKRNKRIFSKSFQYGAITSVVLYLLLALVLKLFDVSIWTFAHFLYFIAGGLVLVCLGWAGIALISFRIYKRNKKRKAAQQQAANKAVYHIQIFDNDPITFS
jgi:hypothetical protein